MKGYTFAVVAALLVAGASASGFGDILSGHTANKTMPTLPKSNFTLPEFKKPEFKLPSLPKFTKPNVTLPDFDLKGLHGLAGNKSLPDVKALHSGLTGNKSLPSFTKPDLPKVTLPKPTFGTKNVTVPTVKLSLDKKSVTVPTVSFTKGSVNASGLHSQVQGVMSQAQTQTTGVMSQAQEAAQGVKGQVQKQAQGVMSQAAKSTKA